MKGLRNFWSDVRRFTSGTRGEVRGWWWILPLAWFVAPSRLGLPGVERLRSRVLVVTLRSGWSIRCRIDEVFTIVEVFGLREYGDAHFTPSSSRAVIVDVGANIGVATVWLARRFPEAEVLAIEPSKDALGRLRDNVERNRLGGRVKAIYGGVGARDGRAALLAGATSSLNRLGPETGRDREEVVPVFSLRSVVAAAGGFVDLLKVDCEGAEYDLFSGDLPISPSVVGVIVGEFHRAGTPEHQRLMQRFGANGYSVRITLRSGGCGTFVCTPSPCTKLGVRKPTAGSV